MGYTKQTWFDRIVQFPRRFTKSGETETSVTLTADPGTVTEPGAPVNAARLNHMEQGIKDALPKDGSEPMTGPLQAPSISVGSEQVWHTGQLRNNAGILELYTEGEWIPVGGIKSVQRGVTNTGESAVDVTISAVNPSKSSANLLSTISAGMAVVQLLNGTTLRLNGISGTYVTVSWEVIEYY